MAEQERRSYATVNDLSNLMRDKGQKYFEGMEQYHKFNIKDGKTKTVTRAGIQNLIDVYENLGVAANAAPRLALQALSDAWSSGRGGGVKDWNGHKDHYTVSSLGSLMLRVGTNKTGNKGFFDVGQGHKLLVNYSKDGKKITITNE